MHLALGRASSVVADREELERKRELEKKEEEMKRLSSLLEVNETQTQALLEELQRQRHHNEDLIYQMDKLKTEALRFHLDLMKTEKQKNNIKLEMENFKSVIESERKVDDTLHKLVSIILYL